MFKVYDKPGGEIILAVRLECVSTIIRGTAMTVWVDDNGDRLPYGTLVPPGCNLVHIPRSRVYYDSGNTMAFIETEESIASVVERLEDARFEEAQLKGVMGGHFTDEQVDDIRDALAFKGAFKPALGVMPRKIWIEQRVEALRKAIERRLIYLRHPRGIETRDDQVEEWMKEFISLLDGQELTREQMKLIERRKRDAHARDLAQAGEGKPSDTDLLDRLLEIGDNFVPLRNSYGLDKEGFRHCVEELRRRLQQRRDEHGGGKL